MFRRTAVTAEMVLHLQSLDRQQRMAVAAVADPTVQPPVLEARVVAGPEVIHPQQLQQGHQTLAAAVAVLVTAQVRRPAQEAQVGPASSS